MLYRTRLQEKLDEALAAVLPIIGIVLLLSLTVAPLTAGVLLAFLLGSVLLLVGMMFFTLGAELAMEPMGQQVGARITKTRKLWIILPVGFLLGMLITVSEPDLQVLAGQVRAIPNRVLIFSVAGGVGLFLTLALLRMLYFLPFYGLGIFYRRVLERLDRLPHIPYFALVFLIQYLIILLCGRIPYYTPSRCDDFVEGGIVPFVVGFTAIAFWLRTAKILEPALGRDRFLNTIADSSYSIMVNQYLGFMAVKTGFALFRAFTSRCRNFDMAEYKSNLAYFYAPGGRIFYLVYLIAGLLVPILMQKLVDRCKAALRRKTSPAV